MSQEKIYTNVQELIKSTEGKGTIAFTNGCFDIVHAGHIEYLEKSKALADLLIVAVNDDNSVQRLKGKGRPIISLEYRLKTLAGLSSVDLLISFSESTPLKLVEEIKPDVLIKGADYQLTEIVGYDSVIKNGGKVMTIELTEGCSTTSIINKIKAL